MGSSTEDDHTWSSILRPGIGRRLLLLILLTSSLITLILTATQLYLDYRRDLDGIERRLDEIERSNLGTIASSLWKLDADQLQLQLDGIVRLPDMLGAEVAEAGASQKASLLIRAGKVRETSVVRRVAPIVYQDRDIRRSLGTLTVTATLDEVYRRLIDKTVVILVSQGIKTFLVSFFILYIVHRIVTRHLTGLAGYLGRFDIRHPAPPFRLQRRQRAGKDELDKVVDALSAARSNLEQAYADLSRANAELEQDIAARNAAEEEVLRLNAVLEQRVLQRTAELEAANRELSAFTYSVSHDLRAPLRTINGFSRLLDEQYKERIDDKGRQYLDRVCTGALKMERLIEDLLRLSQVSRQEMRVGMVDLSALAREVADELQAENPQRSVRFEIEPGLLAAGDAGLLRVALQNLIGNAWKYSSKRESARIEFGYAGQDAHRVLFVRDNGVGFDMAYADKLFGAFQRLHSPAEFPGNGIGLATVSRVIQRHGGKVWAEGKVGAGATFYFTLEGHPSDARACQ